VRFYTLPPSGINYPYLLVNPRTYKILFKTRFEHAILDCGVETFRFNDLRDYPPAFLKKWKHMAVQLTEIFGDKLWVTIPDYPDDITPNRFGDNVEKTLQNIKEFITIKGVNWLPVIQSKYLDKFSFLYSAHKLKEIIGDYPRVAIGTVCKTGNLDFIEYCCKAARKAFPTSHIHAFGLTLKALPKVHIYITSWDSLVPECGRKKGRHWLLDSFNRNCNLDERRKFFYAYLERVNQILLGNGGV